MLISFGVWEIDWYYKCYLKNYVKKSSKSGPKMSITSISKVLFICRDQKSGADGWEKKCKKLSTWRQITE